MEILGGLRKWVGKIVDNAREIEAMGKVCCCCCCWGMGVVFCCSSLDVWFSRLLFDDWLLGSIFKVLSEKWRGKEEEEEQEVEMKR